MFLELAQFIFIFGLILLTLSSILLNINKIKLSIHLLFTGIILSILSLLIAFVQDDFSIHYVYQHSKSSLPLLLKIAALWSAHEGSVLIFLFFLLLGIEVILRHPQVALSQNTIPWRYLSISLCSFCWYFFIFSPIYQRILPFPPYEGADLNPLLQDYSLSYHPPLLLFGTALTYPVAVSSVFCLTGVNCLLLYRLVLMASTGILTLGITFGSMWAYHVLGWGGWWFWDPVETISLIPWFGNLYLIHESYQKKISLSSLLIWIAILLGQWMVRSNYIVSVHSFAQTHSSTGLILILMSTSIISLITFLKMKNPKKESPAHLVKTGAKILGICFLVILFGLLWPMLANFYQENQIHLDGDFYNIILGTLLTSGLLLWAFQRKKNSYKFYISFIAFLILSFLFSLKTILAISLVGLIAGLFQKKNLSWYYHQLVFLFIGICSLFGTFSSQQEYLLKFNQEQSFSKFKILISPSSKVLDSDEKSIIEHVVFMTLNSGKKITLKPQRIFFHSQHQEIVKMDWHVGVYHEYMVCLGEQLDSSTILVRVYHRPFVRLIWLLGITSGLGMSLYASFKLFFTNNRQSSRKI